MKGRPAGSNKAPVISQLLSIGAIADHLATDSEIQAIQDRIADLLKRQGVQDLYWQLNSDLNVLRLHDSAQASKICKDILKSLLLRYEEINWKNYSPEVTAFHGEWKMNQEKVVAYGWEERVSGEARVMIVAIAKLTQALIQQLRLEIQGTST